MPRPEDVVTTPAFGPDDWLKVLLEEYKALRAEIVAALQLQQQVVAFGVTVLAGVSAVSAAILKDDPLAAMLVGSLSPAIALALLLVWLGELERMVRAGTWVALLERRVGLLFPDLPSPLGWESALRGINSPFPSSRVLHRYRGILAVFILLSLAPSLAAFFADVEHTNALRLVILSLVALVSAMSVRVYVARERKAVALAQLNVNAIATPWR